MLHKSFPEFQLPLVVSVRIDSTGENATPVDKLLGGVLQFDAQLTI